jgi:hypothetical protein
MFAEPTINDYLDNIRWHLDKALTNAKHAVSRIQVEHASRGILDSSMTVSRVAGDVKKEFDAGVEAALGELRRAVSKTRLDPRELRQATAQCLTNFAIAVKSVADPGPLRRLAGKAADEWRKALDDDLTFKLRQFDVGFFTPHEPEVPQVSNAINIGSMTNSALQQGSPGAIQSQNVAIKIDEAKAAIAALEASYGELDLPIEKLRDLQSDLATIKAQFAKATPSHSIVGEAARSIRNVAEGAVGGILTPSITAALVALGKATGAY